MLAILLRKRQTDIPLYDVRETLSEEQGKRDREKETVLQRQSTVHSKDLTVNIQSESSYELQCPEKQTEAQSEEQTLLQYIKKES